MKDLTGYLTVNQIAAETGHSVPGVHYAVKRHKIKPSYLLPNNIRLFKPAAVDMVRQKMRKPRRKTVA